MHAPSGKGTEKSWHHACKINYATGKKRSERYPPQPFAASDISDREVAVFYHTPKETLI